MSKTRKILSIVLAVVMAFGVFSICAFADTPTATWTVEVTATDGSALPATIPTGTQVKVTVKLATNFYVGTVGLPVYFSNAFSYVDNSAVQAEIYGAGATRTAFNGNYTADTGYKAVYALYVPNSGAPGVASPMYSAATTVLTFVLEADSEATAVIKLDDAKQKSTTNVGGPFYCGSRDSADVTTDEAMVGQTFNVTGAEATVVIANTAATPVLTGVDTGYVDDANGYVYGIPVGADAADYFTVANGTFTVSGTATGETLTVYDSTNAVYATYTVIIFGDVNGDGAVDLTDKSDVYDSTLPGGGFSAPEFEFAADVNGDGSVDLTDKSDIYDSTLPGGSIPVNPFA
jgi:hypothetical protein